MTRGDDPQIPLASAIRELRQQIVTAALEGQGQDVQFELGPIELELQVQMSRQGGAEGAIKMWVVSLGGKGSRSSTKTHTVRLSLTPIDYSGGDGGGSGRPAGGGPGRRPLLH